MEIVVSKIDAARRQLETAIRLFIYDQDAVAIHTLAAASFNVVNDLVRQSGHDKDSMQDTILKYVREDKKKWMVNQFRKTENFVKHADKDPDDKHSFNPDMTTLVLIDAVRCYIIITGEKTLLMDAYFIWYIIKYPGIFIVPSELKDATPMIQELSADMPKSIFFDAVIQMLIKNGMCI